MAADTSEKGLESIIEAHLLKTGWIKRESKDFDKEFCVDLGALRSFLNETQPEKVVQSHIFDTPTSTRRFLERLRNQITKEGVSDVLRHGIDHNAVRFTLYYPTPIAQNVVATKQYSKNIFAVVRQLHFSLQRPLDSVDTVLMLNGLPIITMELKNDLTNQTVSDAISQYRTDRDPKELLFTHKRCCVHFAVDDNEVQMCTKLEGEKSWFLPFNKGCNDGAGNPINPNGLKTAYLWEEILQKPFLSEILENYAQVIYEKKEGDKNLKQKTIWPRYHQLEAVRSLLADTQQSNPGRRYLIQHSAGSGKSNSITWLAYQLVNMKEADGITPRFESIIVVTDRVNLDKQIRDNIRAFCNNKNILAWAEDSAELKSSLESGKKIIVSTICKFPFILDAIGKELADKKFAVIIDEAHSSQSGNMATSLNRILSGYGNKGLEFEDNEDGLNELMTHILSGRLMAKNTNFYAFTATPKNKTLEMFGEPFINAAGEKGFKPFHLYSMKQAIEEGFIMDVLQHYTTYDSFYKILKATELNPEFDKKQASRKLRAWVESRPETVEKKARIMVEHFHECVAHKMGGEARCMIICNGIERAIDYFFAIKELLKLRNSPYQAIVAFSGSKQYKGKDVDERSLNQFPSSAIEKTFRTGNYRFLIVADKFQTGYDEPLLHTMYVDKSISSVKSVQTLSRLNRCHPLKKETYVLDFVNKAEDIQADFQTFYKTTILSHETDINKLADKVDLCDSSMVYTEEELQQFNTLYWGGADRERLDPILDTCVARFKELPTGDPEKDGDDISDINQINIKNSMKQFVRLYEFLAAIRDIERPEWEMRSTFLRFLLKKLPKLSIEDYTIGLLDLVDFDRYRLIKNGENDIKLEAKNTEINPIPVSDATLVKQENDMAKLEQIVGDFNQVYGDVEWNDEDLVRNQEEQIKDALKNDPELRDAILNNDENTQLQLVRKVTNMKLGVLTENSTQLQTVYLTNPEVSERADMVHLEYLQELFNPRIDEPWLKEKIIEVFTEDFKNLCGVTYRHLSEVVDWMFKVIDAESPSNLAGLGKIKRTLNLIYKTQGRDDDLHDWLTGLLNRYEPYMKKIYYLIKGRELTREDARMPAFLDAAKAIDVNDLYWTNDSTLANMKSFYEFVHAQRNEEDHNAPEIVDAELRPGIHMTTAMYIYATMINITEIENGSIFGGYGNMDSEVIKAAEE